MAQGQMHHIGSRCTLRRRKRINIRSRRGIRQVWKLFLDGRCSMLPVGSFVSVPAEDPSIFLLPSSSRYDRVSIRFPIDPFRKGTISFQAFLRTESKGRRNDVEAMARSSASQHGRRIGILGACMAHERRRKRKEEEEEGLTEKNVHGRGQVWK